MKIQTFFFFFFTKRPFKITRISLIFIFLTYKRIYLKALYSHQNHVSIFVWFFYWLNTFLNTFNSLLTCSSFFYFLFSRNGLLRPREYHYFSFFIFAFRLSRYLLIISACLCFLSFDHAVPFRFYLFSTRTFISFDFCSVLFSIQAVFVCYF